MRVALPVLSLLSLALLAGCASVPQSASMPAPGPVPVVQPAAATPPPNDDLNATVWFQASVERDLVFGEIYRAAGGYLAIALADTSWDALPQGDRSNDPRTLPPAIIVDVDETVLDNSPEQARQIRDNKDFNEADWGAWVEQRAAKPLPGSLEFLRDAAAKGVTVFYISNRDASLADATVDNLRSAGFPIADASQFLGLGTVVDGCEQEGSEKACRRQLVGRGYRVLMQFGDQVGDFVQIVANTPEGRRAAIAPYLGWVGQRWWALPNPMYGSWEPALFNNAWSQPAAERRAAKEAALDDMR
jgi:5'-nucleotidase (lipoprotein e(P4) family)